MKTRIFWLIVIVLILISGCNSGIDHLGLFPTSWKIMDYFFDDIQEIGYLANSREGLIILDLANPTDPQTIGRVELDETPRKIVISGNYAYVGTNSGLFIINIEQKEEPHVIGYYNLPIDGTLSSLEKTGDFIIVGNPIEKGLHILDVSNPSEIKRISEFLPINEDTLYSGFYFLLTINEFVYVFSNEKIYILNILDDPSNPQIVREWDRSRLFKSEQIQSAQLYQDTLYIAEGKNIHMWDVQFADNPKFLTIVSTPNFIYDFTITNNLLVISSQKALEGYNIENLNLENLNLDSSTHRYDWDISGPADIVAIDRFIYAIGNDFQIYEILD